MPNHLRLKLADLAQRTADRLAAPPTSNPAEEIGLIDPKTASANPASSSADTSGNIDPAVKLELEALHGVAIVHEAQTLSDYERTYCTPSAQRNLLVIRGLDDATLLMVAKDEEQESYERLRLLINPDLDQPVNESWVRVRCAEEAYERELIDQWTLETLSM